MKWKSSSYVLRMMVVYPGKYNIIYKFNLYVWPIFDIVGYSIKTKTESSQNLLSSFPTIHDINKYINGKDDKKVLWTRSQIKEHTLLKEVVWKISHRNPKTKQNKTE